MSRSRSPLRQCRTWEIQGKLIDGTVVQTTVRQNDEVWQLRDKFEALVHRRLLVLSGTRVLHTQSSLSAEDIEKDTCVQLLIDRNSEILDDVLGRGNNWPGLQFERMRLQLRESGDVQENGTIVLRLNPFFVDRLESMRNSDGTSAMELLQNHNLITLR